MENNGNQNLASSLCSAGCGFFGNAQFNGMCSKCYKDFVKRKQSAPADSSTLLTTSSSAPAACSPSATVPDTTPSVETAMPTVTTINKSETAPGAAAAASSSLPDDSSIPSGEENEGTDSPGKAKKRNRCTTCKKKVGLTGFECRCGGLYCSIHRYSDKHGCAFDYKEEGADYIRKNNPVVVRSKVQKL